MSETSGLLVLDIRSEFCGGSGKRLERMPLAEVEFASAPFPKIGPSKPPPFDVLGEVLGGSTFA